MDSIPLNGPPDCYDCASVDERWKFMFVCPECGNKRCPKATNHRLDCTGSNASGQPGSMYGGSPQLTEKIDYGNLFK